MIDVEITIHEVEIAAFEHQLTNYLNPMTHSLKFKFKIGKKFWIIFWTSTYEIRIYYFHESQKLEWQFNHLNFNQLEMKSSYNKLFLRLKTVARKGSNQSQTGKTSIRKEPEIHSLHGHRNRKLYMRLLLDAQERRWTRNSNEDGRLLASKRRGISETTCFMMISFEVDVKRQFEV